MKKIPLIFLIIAFQSLAQDFAKFNWSRLDFDPDAYIDHSKMTGDKLVGFKVVTLNSYDSISSAQMFGLSEITEMEINCQKGTMRDLRITWTEKSMGKGKITNKDGPFEKYAIRNLLEGSFQRKLFTYICK